MKSRNVNIIFLILHYKTINETKNCIASIQKLIFKNCKKKIVIVNNNPKELDQVKQLNELAEIKDVYIVHIGENLGFSNGNNVGYRYIKKHFPDTDFILCINSDIIFQKKDCIEKMLKSYEKDNWDVCGPDIIQKDIYFSDIEHHVSPISDHIESLEEACDIIKSCKKIVDRKYLQYVRWILIKILKKGQYFKREIFKRKRESLAIYGDKSRNVFEKQKNVMLYGCALAFSKRFILQQEELFTPPTYLYHEEPILFLRCNREKYLMEYDPSWSVLHMDGASTTDGKNEWKKAIFRAEEQLKATDIYIKYLLMEDKY